MKIKDLLKVCNEQTYVIFGIEQFFTKDELEKQYGEKDIESFNFEYDYEDAYNPLENFFTYVEIYLEK